jgi:FtsZ-interacting cell division protein ZipA
MDTELDLNPEESTLSKVTNIISSHPQLVLAVIVLLIVGLLVVCFWPAAKTKEKMKGTSLLEDDEDNFDELIKSIHKKQKKTK